MRAQKKISNLGLNWPFKDSYCGTSQSIPEGARVSTNAPPNATKIYKAARKVQSTDKRHRRVRTNNLPQNVSAIEGSPNDYNTVGSPANNKRVLLTSNKRKKPINFPLIMEDAGRGLNLKGKVAPAKKPATPLTSAPVKPISKKSSARQSLNSPPTRRVDPIDIPTPVVEEN